MLKQISGATSRTSGAVGLDGAGISISKEHQGPAASLLETTLRNGCPQVLGLPSSREPEDMVKTGAEAAKKIARLLV